MHTRITYKNSELEDVFGLHRVRLTESMQDGTKYRCVIIEEGETATANQSLTVNGSAVRLKKYYTAEALKEAVRRKVFEGAVCLLRSEEEHLSSSDTGVSRIVGWFSEVEWNEERKAVMGYLNVKEGGDEHIRFRRKLAELWNSSKNIGLSISAFGTWVCEKVKDGYIAVVKAIDNVQSVDICERGNAGGRLTALVESAISELAISNEQVKNTNHKIAFIKEDDSSAGSAKAENQNHKNNYKTKQTEEMNSEQIQNQLDEIKKLNAEVKLNKKLAGVSLTESAKDLARQVYTDSGYNDRLLDDFIKKQQTILAESNPVKVNNFGADTRQTFSGGISQGLTDFDKVQRSFEWLMLSHHVRQNMSEAERAYFKPVMGRYSLKELYTSFTGDYRVTGRVAGGSLAESVSTTTFADILGNAMHRSMVMEYKTSPYNDDWRKVSEVVIISDFKEQKRMREGAYGDLPVVTENSAYPNATTPGEEAVAYNLLKRGYIETVSIEAIINDDLQQISRIPQLWGRAAKRTLYKGVFNLITTNEEMSYDGKALVHADHNNKLTTALDASSYASARMMLANQTDLSGNEKLGISPAHLLVPIGLEKTAYELTAAGFGQNNGTPQFYQTWNVEPIILRHVTDGNDWWLTGTSAEVPIIEVGFYPGHENEPEFFVADNPREGYAFTNDQIKYKVRHIWNAQLLDHRGVVGSQVA